MITEDNIPLKNTLNHLFMIKFYSFNIVFQVGEIFLLGGFSNGNIYVASEK